MEKAADHHAVQLDHSMVAPLLRSTVGRMFSGFRPCRLALLPPTSPNLSILSDCHCSLSPLWLVGGVTASSFFFTSQMFGQWCLHVLTEWDSSKTLHSSGLNNIAGVSGVCFGNWFWSAKQFVSLHWFRFRRSKMILLTRRVFAFLALETLSLALAKVHLWFVSPESLKFISLFLAIAPTGFPSDSCLVFFSVTALTM